MRHRHLAIASLALAAAPASLAAQAGACGGRAGCVERRELVAAITDFRVSQQDRGTRMVTATVRFVNRLPRSLLLGFVQESGIVTDDQGNRYVTYGAGSVRGIGEITRNSFDPKFILQAGEGSDARFEFVFRQSSANQILGTAFEMDLAVREIEPVAGNQFRLGKEHALHFRGLANAAMVSAPVAPAAASAPPAPTQDAPSAAAPAPQMPDPCAERRACYAAGPFVAEIVQLQEGRLAQPAGDHAMRLTMRIRNVAAQPLLLAYKSGTSLGIDNLGNRYYWGRAGTYDTSVQGLGVVTSRGADARFALAPGESGTATFELRRYATGRNEIGTSWSHDVTLVQLEPLPSKQVRSVREYAVGFRDLAPGALGGAAGAGGATEVTGAAAEAARKAGDAAKAGKRALDELRRKLKKP